MSLRGANGSERRSNDNRKESLTKRRFYLSFAFFILLSGCASPALAPTETPVVKPTLPATFTQTPSPTETAIPTITDSAPAILPEQQAAIDEAKALFAEIGITDLSGYTFGTYASNNNGVDGFSAVATDPTGKEIYRDGFDLHWLIPNLPAENLLKTNIKPLNMPQRVDPYDFSSDYYVKISNNPEVSKVFPDKQFILFDLLLRDFENDGDSGYAWGDVLIDKLGRVSPVLAYYNPDGELLVTPIEPITAKEINEEFYSNPGYLSKP